MLKINQKNKRNFKIMQYIIVFVISFCLIFGLIGTFSVNTAYAAEKASSIMTGIATVLGWIAFLISYVVGMIATVLISVLVWIAQFNNIIGVTAVKTGWGIVRDICNMFFVLILLVIAFATILRRESYSAKVLLPKVLIMAVLINFSKTIFGLIIDFSQVVMLTFVSGFATNGAGQFVSMFQMDKYFSMSEVSNQAKASGSALGVAAGIVMGVIAMIVTVIVIAVLLAVLVMRIVMLWVYTIMSPLVFLGFAFPPVGKYTGQIFSDFTKQVVVGPILAFFIWLALYTASNSSTDLGTMKGVSEAYNVNTKIENQTESYSVTTPNGLFSTPNFQTYVITLAMLIGGLMVTQQMGGAAASIAGKGMSAIKKGQGWAFNKAKDISKGTAKNMAKATGRGALGVAGFTLAKTPLNKIDSLNKIGKFANDWRGSLIGNRNDEKRDKRLKTLKAMGMNDTAMDSLKDVADSSLGKNVKTIGGVAATAVGALAGGLPTAFVSAIPTLAHMGDNLFKRHGQRSQQRKESEIADLNKETQDKKDDALRNKNSILSRHESLRDNEIKNAENDRKGKLKEADDAFKVDNNAKAREAKIKAANTEFDIAKKEAEDKFNNSDEVKKAAKGYEDKINEINTDHTARNKTISDSGTKFEKWVENNWKDYHPNKVTMDAANKGSEDIKKAKEKVRVLSEGENIHEMTKETFYTGSGQTDSQKEFFKALSAANENSTKAIQNMVDTLNKISNKDIKTSDKQLSAIQSLKQGLAAFKKGGGNMGNFQDLISAINKIKTGDGTDEKHNYSVEDFEKKVIAKE